MRKKAKRWLGRYGHWLVSGIMLITGGVITFLVLPKFRELLLPPAWERALPAPTRFVIEAPLLLWAGVWLGVAIIAGLIWRQLSKKHNALLEVVLYLFFCCVMGFMIISLSLPLFGTLS